MVENFYSNPLGAPNVGNAIVRGEFYFYLSETKLSDAIGDPVTSFFLCRLWILINHKGQQSQIH